MKCEKIQQNLLDYGEGLLSGSEAKKIRTHLAECAECRNLLKEELAFSRKLSAIQEMEPANDVWALVRAQIKPKRASFGSYLSAFFRVNKPLQRIAAGAFATIAAAVVIAGIMANQEPPKQASDKYIAVNPAVEIKWSDDPMGNHSDTMVSVINDM